MIHKSNKSFIPRGWVYFPRTIQKPKGQIAMSGTDAQVLLQWGQERMQGKSKPPQHSPRAEPPYSLLWSG